MLTGEVERSLLTLHWRKFKKLLVTRYLGFLAFVVFSISVMFTS